ncbi:RNA-binding domain-containing protein [Agriterribacter sp.]|uniref:RNA-binding domain-containing protein n=1 Tax=Agriterribacter sp. TaxID=2821509 RepID=UPI002C11F1ED|nr:RNA-binding domain-containing protein [Agriterribacter sp.]HRP58122.1 putative DNA binding domain-containing protein [Agriterribacter sp.]
MTGQELKIKLRQLQNLEAEDEIVEFKEAKTGYDSAKLGKYFSALSNEANLMKKEGAWLVFGIENKEHKVVGTKYRENRADLDKLKKELADKTSNHITFLEIYELNFPEGRVVLFQIPPAPKGMPVSYEGHFYGRDGESLVPLNLEEIERIRVQSISFDWSAHIIPTATIDDLDEEAVKKARVEFIKRNPKYREEEPHWENSRFLDKAKLTIKGKVTRTALILLGKEEAEHFLGSFVKIRWNLRTVKNEDKDFEIFSIPFILTVDEVYKKIRNLKYRYLRDNTLFPDEVMRYDPFNIREPLNNAIAHQDYSKGSRINVVEFEDDHLVFSNYGAFLPKSVEEVVLNDSPEEIYRNPFLVEAMKNLDMIETQGGGIRKIFNFQRQRFFPLPDYDLSEGKVKVTISGKILDEDFARILIQNPKLSLEEIILLDKVQKKKLVGDAEFRYLKKLGFIEGRRKNCYLSFNVVQPIDDDELKAQYIRNRSFDDDHFRDMIMDYLKKYKTATRKSIEILLFDKLSDALSEDQKKKKVANLLLSLRQKGRIIFDNQKEWKLTEIL